MISLHLLEIKLSDVDSGEILAWSRKSPRSFVNLGKSNGTDDCRFWLTKFLEMVATGKNLNLELTAHEYTPLTELDLFE